MENVKDLSKENRRTRSWRRTASVLFLTGSLAVAPFAGGQKTEMVERMLLEMSPDARAALEQTLKEQGMSLDDLRKNPKLLREVMSGEMRQKLQDAVQKKTKESGGGKEKSANAASKMVPQGNVLPPLPSPQGGGNYGHLPARYRVIAEKNLFRPLGWGGDPWQNPFTLIGLATSGGQRRAIMSRGEVGLYVSVGEDVGEGYRVAGIEGNSVKLRGGSHGEIALQLDTGIVGLRGAPAPVLQPMTKQPVYEQKSGDGRWRPARGTSPDAILKEVLAREKLRMDDLKNPKIEAKLKDKYGYLIEEGYAPK